MIHIKVPATSANCSLGFDSMGLALNWMADFYFRENNEIEITGCPEEYCNEQNLVVVSYRKACQELGVEEINFSLEVRSDIPFARGLGSSSTCVVAGVLAAFEFNKIEFDQERALEIATMIEGHPDNVAPAIYGGLIACFEQDGKVIHSKAYLDEWNVLAVIPDYEVKTSEARKILPQEISLKDAAGQVGRALVFYEAFKAGNVKKARLAAKDKLHEPYRSTLIAEYPVVMQAAEQHGALCWISGSGSTMLVLSRESRALSRISRELSDQLPDVRLEHLSISNFGAKVHNE